MSFCADSIARPVYKLAEVLFGAPKCARGQIIIQSDHISNVPSATIREANAGPTEVVPNSARTQEAVSQKTEQQLGFIDDAPEAILRFNPVQDSTFMGDNIDAASLGDFLGRPKIIRSYTWSNGVPFGFETFNPWFEFFNLDPVKRKIDNFGFVQCNLNLKVVINASPFYYGALVMAYRPLTDFTNNPAANISFGDLLNKILTTLPHIMVYPSTNQGGTIVLPFVNNRDQLDLTSAEQLNRMGTVIVTDIVPLANVNDIVGDSINVQVYCWASDVRLTAPTTKLAVQSDHDMLNKVVGVGKEVAEEMSKNEYATGPVSRISSAVAAVGRVISKVPVIAPFAKATAIGADAVGRIASLFGFTNVPVISDTNPVLNTQFRGLASAGTGTPLDKLTLDPKNELTVDPRTVGLTGGDELAISYLCGKECILTTFEWSSTDQENFFLFSSPVAPHVMYSRAIVPGANQIGMSPACMVAHNFQFWRGDVIFRFRAVCTQYHKGRIRIVWDPLFGLITNSDVTQTSFTKLVDLTPDMDVEVRVPMAQVYHWLEVQSVEANPGFVYYRKSGEVRPDFIDENTINGMLSINVVNELSAPVASSSVTIIVFTRMADNAEFMGPKSQFTPSSSYFVPQSDHQNITGGVSAPAGGERYLVYGGEAVGSMRPLLRRHYSEGPIAFTQFTPDPTHFKRYSAYFRQYPLIPGYDPHGPHRVTSPVSAVDRNYYFSSFTPFTLLGPCFIGMRGSMHWMLNINKYPSPRTVNHFTVQRRDDFLPESAGNSSTIIAGITTNPATNVAEVAAFYSRSVDPTGSMGLALTNTRTQSSLQISAPLYLNNRLMPVNIQTWSTNRFASPRPLRGDPGHLMTEIDVLPEDPADESNRLTIDRYVGIGTDFNFYGFMFVPPIYIYDEMPTPVA